MIRTARVAGLVAALGVLAVAVVLSLWLGSTDIAFGDALAVLWRDDGSTDAVTIRQVRAPRAALAILVGIALGLSGAVMQALTRNPLAEPGLLGVTMGSSTAVVVAIGFFGLSGVLAHVWFAIIGAALAATVVYLLGATGRSIVTPDRIVLAGAAVTAVLLAFNSAVLLLDPLAFNEFRFWNVGSLAGRRADVLAVVAPFVLAGTVLTLALAHALNALALGEDAGRGLGANVTLVRVLAAIALTVLCGAATAAAGPIVFVGLAVPHVARMIAGPDQRWVMAYSVVLGPILMLVGDVIGRVIIAPREMQVGIVIAFIGAPVFLALCLRSKVSL
ncbi:iron complex transport system permease protein [Herbihabitans rhizosphaerae]|uniref:Iron complex transport system permease protein n=1 Tax=Herbihabitans rhizosphaerae TaxID=1872711 RepID=A0A4Q7KMZ3_9PSEU|nr:iron chelate uptake ABC transporter family permease subunit [Herbihabitans rhizosphaerae]RZS36582.1 iron complex transport system permease protein [Herbihabitans rhizosphaerae]